MKIKSCILFFFRSTAQDWPKSPPSLWVASGLILPNTPVVIIVINKHQVKDCVALDFMLDVLSVG